MYNSRKYLHVVGLVALYQVVEQSNEHQYALNKLIITFASKYRKLPRSFVYTSNKNVFSKLQFIISVQCLFIKCHSLSVYLSVSLFLKVVSPLITSLPNLMHTGAFFNFFAIKDDVTYISISFTQF